MPDSECTDRFLDIHGVMLEYRSRLVHWTIKEFAHVGTGPGS
jgi:hypothetical protein